MWRIRTTHSSAPPFTSTRARTIPGATRARTASPRRWTSAANETAGPGRGAGRADSDEPAARRGAQAAVSERGRLLAALRRSAALHGVRDGPEDESGRSAHRLRILDDGHGA